MCYLFRGNLNALALGLALVAVGLAEAREQPTGLDAKIDVERVGPKVGAGVPDFSLRDQRGELHTLKSLLGPKGVVIVFFRSADW